MPECCPRCAYETVDHVASSPVVGVWEVFGCPRCNYFWRSTEPRARTSRPLFPEKYRLTAETVAAAPPYPGIPPLRQQKSNQKENQ